MFSGVSASLGVTGSWSPTLAGCSLQGTHEALRKQHGNPFLLAYRQDVSKTATCSFHLQSGTMLWELSEDTENAEELGLHKVIPVRRQRFFLNVCPCVRVCVYTHGHAGVHRAQERGSGCLELQAVVKP